MKAIPILQKRRIAKNPPRPYNCHYVFESCPAGDYRSWEFFSPVERSELLVQKLHIKFDLHPPSFPSRYQATVGDISWLADWEVALLGCSSLWSIHCKLIEQTQYLSTLGKGSAVLVENEFETFHLTLRLIEKYPELCSRVSFCKTSKDVNRTRLSSCTSIRPRPSPEPESESEPGEHSCTSDCELCAASHLQYTPPQFPTDLCP